MVIYNTMLAQTENINNNDNNDYHVQMFVFVCNKHRFGFKQQHNSHK